MPKGNKGTWNFQNHRTWYITQHAQTSFTSSGHCAPHNLKSTLFTKDSGLLAILNQGAWMSMSPCELSHVMTPRELKIQIKIPISVNHSYKWLAYKRLTTYPVPYCRECVVMCSLVPGGYLGQLSLGTCPWPLRDPSSLQSILWPIKLHPSHFWENM